MAKTTQTKEKNRTEEKYQKDVVAALKKQLGAKSEMQVPRHEKIVIKVCFGEATENPK